jgi:hypothetical protein
MFPIVETLDIGEVLNIEASGRYLEITDLTGGVEIRLTTREGREVASGKAVLIGTFFNPSEKFETITITNTSGAATTIRAFYGDGQAGSRRVSGSVSITGGVTTSPDNFGQGLANFDGHTQHVMTASAGLWNYSNVYNPVGSGRNVAVISMRVRANTVGSIQVGMFAGGGLGSFIKKFRSKRAGGTSANGVNINAELYGGVTASVFGQWDTYDIPTINTDREFVFPRPWVLPPDHMFYTYHSLQNVATTMSFEIQEKPI